MRIEKETFRRQRHHQSLMMALTPKRLFLYLCISISLLRPYTLFSRSPLVNKTLFENACELEWVVLYFKGLFALLIMHLKNQLTSMTSSVRKFDPDNLLAEEDGIRFEPHQMPMKWKGETRKEKRSKQDGVLCEIVTLNNPLFSPFFTGAFIEIGWSETWGLAKRT